MPAPIAVNNSTNEPSGRSRTLLSERERTRRRGHTSSAEQKHGRLSCVFSVEVLGEGVDAPDVDTIFLLRPTQSATVFSQQLGRGLRRAQNKSHLTVIDLIGQQDHEFRFEDHLSAYR